MARRHRYGGDQAPRRTYEPGSLSSGGGSPRSRTGWSITSNISNYNALIGSTGYCPRIMTRPGKRLLDRRRPSRGRIMISGVAPPHDVWRRGWRACFGHGPCHPAHGLRSEPRGEAGGDNVRRSLGGSPSLFFCDGRRRHPLSVNNMVARTDHGMIPLGTRSHEVRK
jgi:hypothetical protein